MNAAGTVSSRSKRPLFIYPYDKSKGGIAVTLSDYRTLEQEVYLNDVVVDFYLLFLMNNVLPEEYRRSIHVYSSLFFKRLSTRFGSPGEDEGLISPLDRHLRVTTWTKNVNIFEKKMIVVPICENNHWFLLLVVRPDLMKTSLRLNNEYPFIVVLDSIGKSQEATVELVREYLQAEWNVKMVGIKLVNGANSLPTVIPVKPQQTNDTDCGVFLLHYVELMFADLDIFLLAGQFSKLSSWFDIDSIATKRYEIGEIIMRNAKDLGCIEVDHFPQLRYSSQKNGVVVIDIRLIDPDHHVKT